jgi:hypothetical protein
MKEDYPMASRKRKGESETSRRKEKDPMKSKMVRTVQNHLQPQHPNPQSHRLKRNASSMNLRAMLVFPILTHKVPGVRRIPSRPLYLKTWSTLMKRKLFPGWLRTGKSQMTG